MLCVHFNVVSIIINLLTLTGGVEKMEVTSHPPSANALSHDMENIAGTAIFCKGSRNKLAI